MSKQPRHAAKKQNRSATGDREQRINRSIADRVDEDLAASAIAKRRSGEIPTSRELAALRRIEKSREERLRWEYYRSIPLKHWQEMSGRHRSQLAQQAALYGIDFGSSPIDLPKVVRQIHDFLAQNHQRLIQGDDDGLFTGSDVSLKNELLRVRIERERFGLDKDYDRFIEREVIREMLMKGAAVLRKAGETLGRKFGDEAQLSLDEALDEWEAKVLAEWGDEGGGRGGQASTVPTQPA